MTAPATAGIGHRARAARRRGRGEPVVVLEEISAPLARRTAASHVSPPQTIDAAVALARPLLNCPVTRPALAHPVPGGRRIVTVRPAGAS